MDDTPSWRSKGVPPYTPQNSKSPYPGYPSCHEDVPWGFSGLGTHLTRRLRIRTRPSCSMKDHLLIPPKKRPGYIIILRGPKNNMWGQCTGIIMHILWGIAY